MQHKFNLEHGKHLLGDERRTLIDRARFLDQLDIKEGDITADLRAGPGFFTLPLAERRVPSPRTSIHSGIADSAGRSDCDGKCDRVR